MNRGWLNKDGLRRLGVIGAMVLVTSFGSGCSTSGSGADGMDDEAMSETGSMNQFEAGGTVSGGGAFQDVQFAFDSSGLDPAAEAAITFNADYLRDNSSVRAEVEGHCDDRGTAEYNLALGARRAKAVRDALVAKGISGSRVSTVSYGEELPLCKDKTEGCWGRNRRAHLVDLSK